MSELCVGRIVAVHEHPGAHAPSYRVTLQLEGRQLLCRGDVDDVIVVAAHSHAGGLVLLRPDRDVENGTLVD